MRTHTRAAVLLTCLGCTLPVCSPAIASPTPLIPRFELSATNGYTFVVEKLGRRVKVRAERDTSGQLERMEIGEYEVLADAGVPKNDIDARFGGLGEIAVHFQPSGERVEHHRRVPHGCSGARRIIEYTGTFVGTIRFQGEDGYTEVQANEAPGTVGTDQSVGCMVGKLFGSGSTSLLAARKDVVMLAMRRGRHPATFLAGILEKTEDLSISRLAQVEAPPQTFRFGHRLGWASVTPPAPFAGSARFSHPKGSRPRWSGSLSVDLPGAPATPLTGPGFYAGFDPLGL